MYYVSFVPTFFVWWYGRGLKDLFSFLSALFVYIQNMFSVVTLLKTLFSPWKKMAGPRRPGLDGLKDWMLDNIISRGVGFVMRVGMMMIFLVAFFIFLVFSLLIIALWLGMPMVIVASFFYIFWGTK